MTLRLNEICASFITIRAIKHLIVIRDNKKLTLLLK